MLQEIKRKERLGSKIIRRQCNDYSSRIGGGSRDACQKITANRLLVQESFLRAAGCVARAGVVSAVRNRANRRCSELYPKTNGYAEGRKREREGEIEKGRKGKGGGEKEVEASYESRTYFWSAKCKQDDSGAVMHRSIWRKSSSCDD
ncbi:hypothetical protein M0804_010476 [Polistes exclamans]|nr:hypothetical protein M0804_010476 [Polistes exclamans]